MNQKSDQKKSSGEFKMSDDMKASFMDLQKESFVKLSQSKRLWRNVMTEIDAKELGYDKVSAAIKKSVEDVVLSQPKVRSVWAGIVEGMIVGRRFVFSSFYSLFSAGRLMRGFGSAGLAVFLIMVLSTQPLFGIPQVSAKKFSTLILETGEVNIFDKNGDEVAYKPGMKIKEGYEIVTLNDTAATAKLLDDSRIAIGSNSRIQFVKQVISSIDSSETDIEISAKETDNVWVQVLKLGEEASFKFVVDGLDLKVKSMTSFNVTVDSDNVNLQVARNVVKSNAGVIPQNRELDLDSKNQEVVISDIDPEDRDDWFNSNKEKDKRHAIETAVKYTQEAQEKSIKQQNNPSKATPLSAKARLLQAIEQSEAYIFEAQLLLDAKEEEKAHSVLAQLEAINKEIVVIVKNSDDDELRQIAESYFDTVAKSISIQSLINEDLIDITQSIQEAEEDIDPKSDVEVEEESLDSLGEALFNLDNGNLKAAEENLEDYSEKISLVSSPASDDDQKAQLDIIEESVKEAETNVTNESKEADMKDVKAVTAEIEEQVNPFVPIFIEIDEDPIGVELDGPDAYSTKEVLKRSAEYDFRRQAREEQNGLTKTLEESNDIDSGL